MSDEWRAGEYYELAVELGPRSDERLEAALRALAVFVPGVPLPADIRAFLNGEHLTGLATLEQTPVRFGVCAVREDAGPDWFDVYLPMAELHRRWGVATPAEMERSSHKHAVDSFLFGVGEALFRAVPYQLALIGCEVSGYCRAAEFADAAPVASTGIIYLWRDGAELRRVAP